MGVALDLGSGFQEISRWSSRQMFIEGASASENKIHQVPVAPSASCNMGWMVLYHSPRLRAPVNRYCLDSTQKFSSRSKPQFEIASRLVVRPRTIWHMTNSSRSDSTGSDTPYTTSSPALLRAPRRASENPRSCYDNRVPVHSRTDLHRRH
jgi:hypothetical protein